MLIKFNVASKENSCAVKEKNIKEINERLIHRKKENLIARWENLEQKVRDEKWFCLGQMEVCM